MLLATCVLSAMTACSGASRVGGREPALSAKRGTISTMAIASRATTHARRAIIRTAAWSAARITAETQVGSAMSPVMSMRGASGAHMTPTSAYSATLDTSLMQRPLHALNAKITVTAARMKLSVRNPPLDII